MEDKSAKFIGVVRHRLQTDGVGVTTLAAFHHCTLRCQYCLNSQCLSDETKTYEFTPKSLVDSLMVDNLYFLATNGGVTFGGGEPLLQSKFIEEFANLCPDEWCINLESALNVPNEHLKRVAPYITEFIIDIKDMNNDIYQAYTGRSNELTLKNLEWICEQKLQNKCRIRIPLIPDFNTNEDRERSKEKLSQMGFSSFDLFDYMVK